MPSGVTCRDMIGKAKRARSLTGISYICIYVYKQLGELLKSRVDGCLIQNCFVGHRKGNPLLS